MNDTNKGVLIGIGMCVLSLAVGVVLDTNVRKGEALTESAVLREFVCTSDDKLVERHVGVAAADHYDGGVWRIVYEEARSPDGALISPETVAYYLQQAGETCTIEEAFRGSTAL